MLCWMEGVKMLRGKCNMYGRVAKWRDGVSTCPRPRRPVVSGQDYIGTIVF